MYIAASPALYPPVALAYPVDAFAFVITVVVPKLRPTVTGLTAVNFDVRMFDVAAVLPLKSHTTMFVSNGHDADPA